MKTGKFRIKILLLMLVVLLVFLNAQVFAVSTDSSSKQSDTAKKMNSIDNIKTYAKAVELLDKNLYGGMYVDDYGNLNVLHKDLEKVSKFLEKNRSQNQMIVYREAKFSLAELENVYNLLLANMNEIGISTLEIDEINNCVIVGIKNIDDIKKNKINRISKSSCIKIEEIKIEPKDQMAFTVKNGDTLQIQGGASNLFSSCIGVTWTDAGISKYGFLSCAHGLNIGDSIRYNATYMGKVVKRVFSGSVDASIIERSTYPDTFATTRKFTDDTEYTPSSNDAFVSGGFPVGTNVTLYGCATKKITGKITSTTFAISDGGVAFTNLIKTSYISQQGDSGGAIKIDVNSGGLLYTYVAGVHKGGDSVSYGYYSDMSKVKSALGFSGYYAN